MKARIHIFYQFDSLPARCAAAIVGRRCEQQGEKYFFFPYGGNYYANKQRLTVLDRIQRCIYPSINGQLKIPIFSITHDPHEDLAYFLECEVPFEEQDELQSWGVMMNLQTIGHQSVVSQIWKLSFLDQPMPVAVQLLERFDVGGYEQDRAFWYTEVIPFALAMRSVATDPDSSIGREEWQKHFDQLANSHTQKRVKEGLVILRYLQEVRAKAEPAAYPAPVIQEPKPEPVVEAETASEQVVITSDSDELVEDAPEESAMVYEPVDDAPSFDLADFPTQDESEGVDETD